MSLSARTRSLLETARRQAEPSEEDLRRVRAQLSATLAATPEIPSVVAFPLAFLKLVGGIAVAAAVGYGAWEWSKQQPPPPPPVTSTPSAPVVVAAECPPSPECPPAVVAPAPKSLVCPPAPRANKDNAMGSKPGRRLEGHTFSTPFEGDGDRWGLEFGLLADARVALDESRPLDALGHVQKHERLFPTSAFTEERLAIEIIATCQVVGEGEGVRPLVERLLELDSETTYLPRVRSACGVDFGRPKMDPENE